MKTDMFTRVMMVLIFLALMVNALAYLFTPREISAQMPEVLIAQATDKVAEANARMAQAINKLSESLYNSNLKIADAIEKGKGAR